jgi:hypothetical protein
MNNSGPLRGHLMPYQVRGENSVANKLARYELGANTKTALTITRASLASRQPARPPARKYCPSDEVVPPSQIAVIGCLWCALTMARAAT